MHGCDAVVLSVGIRSINLSNRHRNRLPLRIVPRPNSTTSLFPRAASSSTSRTLLPRLALDPVIDNRITQLTRQRARTRPACVPRPNPSWPTLVIPNPGGRCSPPRTGKGRGARRARDASLYLATRSPAREEQYARIISLAAPRRRRTTAVETTPDGFRATLSLSLFANPESFVSYHDRHFAARDATPPFGVADPRAALYVRVDVRVPLSFSCSCSLFLSFARTLDAHKYPRRERASD